MTHVTDTGYETTIPAISLPTTFTRRAKAPPLNIRLGGVLDGEIALHEEHSTLSSAHAGGFDDDEVVLASISEATLAR